VAGSDKPYLSDKIMILYKGGYTLVTLPRIITPYRDNVDGTRARVTNFDTLGYGYIGARTDTTQQSGQTPDKEVGIKNITVYFLKNVFGSVHLCTVH
jgi:hypothetical protein